MKRRTILGILAATLVATMAAGTAATFAATPFKDVKSSDWFYKSVTAISEKNVIKGYTDGTFRPNNTVTYGEFLAMTMQTTGEKIPSTRTDGEHWAIDFYRYGLSKGFYGETEISAKDLNKPISRAYMAVIISGMLGDEIKVNGEYYTLLQNTIRDIDYRHEQEYDITRVYGAGILSGFTDGTFRPDNTLTRAQASSVIWKLIDERQRTVPDKDDLIAAQPVEDTRNQETRIRELEQEGMYSISFDPVKDVTTNEYGIVMKEEKAREYLDQALATMRFSGSNGSYYMDIEFPDLPDGFEFNFVAEVVYNGNLNRPIWTKATQSRFEQFGIPCTGKVLVKVDSLKSLNEILYVRCELVVQSVDDKQAECFYTIMKDYSGTEPNVTNFVIDRRFSTTDKETSSILRGSLDAKYNVDRNFTWK